ncbi:MAG: ABC transporter permease subunit [Spirochaetales bacterium]|nr:ABC transporter permease subunit [Spirochaetales bacterium]
MDFNPDHSLMGVLFFSGRILTASCLTNLLLGTTAGVFLALNPRKRVTRCIDTLATLPLVFPPVGLGFFLLILLGRNGLIGRGLDRFFDVSLIFSPAGVFLAAFVASFPLMLKSVQTSASSLNRSLLEAASLQGADRGQVLCYIILPNIRMGILSGLTLTVGRSLGEVGITLMLGGNISGRTETISLAIYNAVFEGNYGKAAFLSLLLAGISLILFTFIQRRNDNGERE